MIFDGKVAVVTGGAAGIGMECCFKLSQKGITVIALDNNEEGAKAVAEKIISMGGNAEGLRLDVANVNEVRKIVELLVLKYSRIDYLINSAGITQMIGIDEISENDWDRVMDIDLKGTFFMSQAVLEIMKKNKFGRIVNIGSVAGEVGGIVVGANYSAAKAGVICLTKSIAKHGAPYGVNVNTVSPGYIDTKMTKDLNQDVSQVPLGRKGTAEEVSDSVVFLCSDMANYLTGVNLDINGGLYMK